MRDMTDKPLVDWVDVGERPEGQRWGGCRYEVYESAPYESYDRGGAAFKTIEETVTFLEEQARIHTEVGNQYAKAAVSLRQTIMPESVLRFCAWCKKFMGYQPDGPGVTYSICDDCEKKQVRGGGRGT